MTKLYPIGTQLITHRLSQAALFVDVFPESSTEFASFFDPDDEVGVRHLVGFCLSADEWRVMVTEDNQELLSPVPMVGDKIQYHTSPYCSDKVTNIVSIDPNDEDILWVKDDPSTDIDPEEHDINVYQITDILRRTYPNGQRAPLIEWDEVILPTDQKPNTHPAP